MSFTSEDIEYIHQLGSRKTVGYILESLCENNEQIVAAYADVGSRFGLINNNVKGFQCGIAEQSLIGVISGLFHEGFIPYGIAYAPFLIMRALDQIRMSVGQMGLGIKLVGGSAGFVSGNLGAASMALDDISAIRSIPNITILSPADCIEEAKMLIAISKDDKPYYIRLTGGASVKPVYKDDYSYSIGKSNVIHKYGTDAVIYATGTTVADAVDAAQHLAEDGINIVVIDMSTIKPLDKSIIDNYSSVRLAVSIEEHSIYGGLGSAIAEYITTCGYNQRLLRLGVRNDKYPTPNSYGEIKRIHGLNAESISTMIRRELECFQMV